MALTEYVRNAWIKLRFFAPLSGTRTLSAVGGGNNSYIFSYDSSSTTSVAKSWAMETIKWRQERKSLGEWESEIKDEWRKPSEERFNIVMHVAPGEASSWLFM
jgi:hypothetical protein